MLTLVANLLHFCAFLLSLVITQQHDLFVLSAKRAKLLGIVRRVVAMSPFFLAYIEELASYRAGARLVAHKCNTSATIINPVFYKAIIAQSFLFANLH
jgi:hypothetical protein